MSWLRSSPLRQSFTRRTQDFSNSTDSKAVSDSFCKHWQQISDIINRSEVSQKKITFYERDHFCQKIFFDAIVYYK